MNIRAAEVRVAAERAERERKSALLLKAQEAAMDSRVSAHRSVYFRSVLMRYDFVCCREPKTKPVQSAIWKRAFWQSEQKLQSGNLTSNGVWRK